MPRTPHRNPVEELADEFVARFRRGERPAISEYARRHPEHAAEIEEVFPALVMMEQVDSDLKHAAEADTPAPDPVPAHTQLGDFRIIREVGRGGMGIVYEAEQVSLGRRVALKVLPRQSLLDSKHQKRFLREAKAAARLHHTNIVPVFGVGQQDGLHYYVMQFIHGLGLDEVLVELQRLRVESSESRVKASGGRKPADSASVAPQAAAVAQSLLTGHFERTLLVDSDESDQRSAISDQPPETTPPSRSTINHKPSTPAHPDTVVGQLSDTLHASGAFLPPTTHSRHVYWQSVARIGLQAAQALQYAHDQGIVHRDVKPGNLLLDTRGSVWVTDFGLAKAADQQDLTHTGDVLGTLRYMAPEQFDGKADARSDVFSLGLTLYELLALKPAFNERDRHKLIKQVTTGAPPRLRTLDPHVPRDLETIVHKAIDRDSTHRYQTAEALAADLQRYLGDEPIRARWISPVTRFTRWCRRNPAVASLTTTIAVLLAIAAIVSSIAAVKFKELANDKSNLATERGALAEQLQTALDDAESNLELAQTEQNRAERNLDVALTALDAVYLDAIGEKKLLGEPRSAPGYEGSKFQFSRTDLSELERALLTRGLTFYCEFAEQNQNSPAAAVQTAQAYYRVALLQGALEDREAAEQNFAEAINRYQALIRNEPDKHRHRAGLAQAYFGLASLQTRWVDAERNYRLAESAITAAINRNPDVADYYYRRSEIRRSLSDYRPAQQDAEKAVELSPDNVQFLVEAARIYINSSFQHMNAERAVELCERALKSDPQSALVHRQFGAVLWYTDRSRALEQLTEAIRLDPMDPGAFNLRARIYLFRGEHERALADANEAVRLAPDNAQGYKRRAQIYTALNRFAEARANVDAALERCLPGASFHGQMLQVSALLYARTGDYARAEADFTRAIEEAPLLDYLHAGRLRTRFHLEKYDAALEDLRTALKLHPPGGTSPVSFIVNSGNRSFQQGALGILTELLDSPESDRKLKRYCRRFRYQLLLALGRWGEAREELAKSPEFNGAQQAWSDRYTHALLCLALDEEATYRTECRSMLEQFAETKDPAEANFAAWTCLLAPESLDDYSTALALATRASEADPGNDQYQNTLGAVQYRAGRYDEALTRLEQLANRMQEPNRNAKSSPAYAWCFLAMTHHALGHAEEAHTWLTKVNEWTDKVLSDDDNPPVWNRKLTLQLLRAETTRLIEPDAAGDAPMQNGAPELPPAPPSTRRAVDTESPNG